MIPWRVFYTQSGQELKARDELQALGVATFCPFQSFKRHRKRGANVTVGVFWADVPLFPNYLFVRTNSFARVALVRGIIAPVAFGQGPLAVPESIIARLRAVCSPAGLVFKADLTKNSFWFSGRPGDTFRFRNGTPLSGLLGTISDISKLDDSGEIRAWVNVLGGATEVSLDHKDVSLVEATL